MIHGWRKYCDILSIPIILAPLHLEAGTQPQGNSWWLDAAVISVILGAGVFDGTE